MIPAGRNKMGAFITVKTKDNYNGQGTIYYATTGQASLRDLTGMADAVARIAGCPVEKISFRPAGRGNLIMAESPSQKKIQASPEASR
jgi:hypothetical protein